MYYARVQVTTAEQREYDHVMQLITELAGNSVLTTDTNERRCTCEVTMQAKTSWSLCR